MAFLARVKRLEKIFLLNATILSGVVGCGLAREGPAFGICGTGGITSDDSGQAEQI
jgi:hypothetical protein